MKNTLLHCSTRLHRVAKHCGQVASLLKRKQLNNPPAMAWRRTTGGQVKQ